MITISIKNKLIRYQNNSNCRSSLNPMNESYYLIIDAVTHKYQEDFLSFSDNAYDSSLLLS